MRLLLAYPHNVKLKESSGKSWAWLIGIGIGLTAVVATGLWLLRWLLEVIDIFAPYSYIAFAVVLILLAHMALWQMGMWSFINNQGYLPEDEGHRRLSVTLTRGAFWNRPDNWAPGERKEAVTEPIPVHEDAP